MGVFESSKSDMNTLAPELSALMIILRSTGPVISTRRSCRSAGAGATRQVLSSRMWAVSGRKSSVPPASSARRPHHARGQELAPPGLEGAVEPRHEIECLGGEDLRALG